MFKRQKILIIIAIILIIGAVFYVFSRRQPTLPAEMVSSSATTAYSRPLKKLEQVLKIYQATFLSDVKFTSLKTFYPLPLEIGLVGNSRPFQPLISPLEVLLEALQSP